MVFKEDVNYIYIYIALMLDPRLKLKVVNKLLTIIYFNNKNKIK